MDAKKLDELAEKIAKMLPPGVTQLQSELQKDIQSLVQAGLAKLDLVTREEFDVQTKVLLRLQKQIEVLEKKLDKLEPTKKSSTTTRTKTKK